jgi:glycosyltransferase involved in cell wall biosynthesis
MHLVFLTPSPDPAGGGGGFNAGLIPALRALHHTVDTQHDADALPPGATPIVDGMLLPDLEADLDVLLARDAVAIIHHVSSRAGKDLALREDVRTTERRMLPLFRRVVATSQPVADRLAEEYGLTRVRVLQPGLPDLPRSPGSGAPSSENSGCHILSVGVLTPRKGHHRLVQALARLADLNWTLTIAGDAQRDVAHAQAVAALVDDLDLGARIAILPNPSDAALDAAWAAADLFALASSWEGYPAGIAEALRRGIPIVATTVGEVAALTPVAASILCPPDDMATFGKCLRRGICDGALRASLSDAAWIAGQALPGWPAQAAAFETLLRS